MVQVAFNYDLWAARYPELACSISPTLALSFWQEATIFQRNDGGGPVCDPNLQTALLNMLTAHIAKMSATINGVAPSGLVGRVSGATEGSVSVQTQYSSDTSDLAAWANQTPYGATWWAATAQFRTFQYRPGPNARFGPGFGPGWGGLTLWRL